MAIMFNRYYATTTVKSPKPQLYCATKCVEYTPQTIEYRVEDDRKCNKDTNDLVYSFDKTHRTFFKITASKKSIVVDRLRPRLNNIVR